MKIKRILTLSLAAIALFSTTSFAQPGMGGGPGGMGGGPGMGGPGGPMMRAANADPVARTGYFEIDAEKAIKKIKVKDEAEVAQIREAFADFALGSTKVYANYMTEFEQLEAMKEKMGSGMEPDKNSRENMREVMQGSAVIKKEMVVLHKALQADIAAALSNNNRSASRWELYYADICDTEGFSEKTRERGEGGERQGGQWGGHNGGGMRGPGMGGPGGGMGGF